MALSDIVESGLKWMDEASCIGNPEPFDKYDQGGIFAEEADLLCLNCPVIKECFETGSKGQYGQWGGIYWNGNGKPDLRANEHKSSDFLDQVERKVK